MRRYGFGWLAVGLVAIFLISCGGTTITEKRVDKAFRDNPVSDVFVIAVSKKADTRKLFEQKLVAELKNVGMEAVSSMNVLEIPSDFKLEKQTILDALSRYDSDAVIIIHLLDIQYKDAVSRNPDASGGFFGYYGVLYNYRQDPGYATERTNVLLETNLYDVKTEQLIWSGRSTSFSVESARQVVDEVVTAVVRDLQKEKVIAPK